MRAVVVSESAYEERDEVPGVARWRTVSWVSPIASDCC
jgi:hypothetical protein